MGMWSWWRGKKKAARIAKTSRPASVEPLEQRLLFSSDSIGVEPLVLPASPSEPVVYHDLGGENNGGHDNTALSASAESPHALELFGLLPALFVENQGQWSDQTVRYVHDGDGIDVAMTDAGVRFGAADAQGLNLPFFATFLGANAVRPTGREPAGAEFNYYVGDQADWRQGVASYAVVAYEGLYEGIDLCVQGLRSHIKYEFHVAPGADYRQIAVRYEGVERLSLAADGSLEIDLGEGRGVIRDGAPYIYQEIDGQKVQVAGRFILLDDRTYSFEITGDIDPNHALVIDPELVWSTYLGGSDNEDGLDVAVDASGNVCVMGNTSSLSFIEGGLDGVPQGGSDVFVVKFSPSGKYLWGTYLGGALEDSGSDIVIDGSGAICVTGYTRSEGWTSGGFDTTFHGVTDAFVVKLGSDGQHLWSTYLGGGSNDYGDGIAVDAAGRIYVTGSTWYIGLASVSGGYDTSFDGQSDAFLVQLDSGGHHLWSTYLGGDGMDAGCGVAVDASGAVCVTGYTYSPDWTSGGFDTTFNSQSDAFVVKLDSDGHHLWSTYLGGVSYDNATDIGVDAFGNIHVVGGTESAGWVVGGYDVTYRGGYDAFLAKLSPDGQHLWSTCLGGDENDHAYGVAVTASGDVYVTGLNGSTLWYGYRSFDVTDNGGVDVFVAKFGPGGQCLWNLFLGGSDNELGRAIASDGADHIYVIGATLSSDWISGGAFTTHAGASDAFLAKLSDLPDTIPPVVIDFTVSPASVLPGGCFTFSYTVSDTGGSGLSVVELWRTNDLEHWPAEARWQNNAFDNGPASGTFLDVPPTLGDWWYAIRVADGAGNWTPEVPGDSELLHVVVGPAWETEPYATSATSIRMVAIAAPSGIPFEYYFQEVSGHPGGTNSGWQDSAIYEDKGLIAGTSYAYRVTVRHKISGEYAGVYSVVASATTPGPVYRFWSPLTSHHFYTMSLAEKDAIIATYSPSVWTYEGVAFYAFADDAQEGVLPVYRFWSPVTSSHFYTMNEGERDSILATYPSSVWAYEGIAYYTFAAGRQPAGSHAAYRFWSPLASGHFYTTKEDEKDSILTTYPASVWTYEGIAWYVLEA